MEKHNTYLEKIGIPEGSDLYNKILYHYNFYFNDLEVTIDELFVSETINSEGNRIYLNLWFFNDTSLMEIKGFNSKDDYDQDWKSSIIAWNFTRKDYDNIATPIDTSRALLKIFMDNGRQAEIKASKENCTHLFEILKKIPVSELK